MRFLSALALFVLVLSILSASAEAGPKPSIFFWWESHWEQDPARPYLDEAKIPHNARWDRDTWKPEDWAEAKGGAREMIEELYLQGILTDQYTDDDIPVLEVGQGFMNLSGQERLRVVKFIDHVFEVTTSQENGMFYLYHHRKEKPIGIYTKHGLQLQ